MTALATLPMYDWPENHARIDALYAQLRALVPELPETLARPVDEATLHTLWRNPALLLGQTCWGPMQAGLAAHVHVLAQPDYNNVPGGRGALYRSALVMRSGKPCPPPQCDGAELPGGLTGLRLAINAPDSMSGCIALAQDMDISGFVSRAVETGSHRASIQAVATGAADFAAIDCQTWALALEHEPAASTLTVAGWTALRPGLPYVTSRRTAPALRTSLAKALILLGAHPVPQTTCEEIP